VYIDFQGNMGIGISGICSPEVFGEMAWGTASRSLCSHVPLNFGLLSDIFKRERQTESETTGRKMMDLRGDA
jgi:hypothetical protein